MKNISILKILLVCGLALLISPVTNASALTLKANHSHIEIGAGYHGSSVSASGSMEPGAELIVVISSEENPGQSLNHKEKVGGFIWMNTEKITFNNIPELYYVLSTGNPSEILSQSQMIQHNIGYDALYQDLQLDPEKTAARKKELFEQLVLFKEKNRLFGLKPGGFEIKTTGGQQTYYTVMDWPYQAPPGKYTVRAYSVKDGKITETTDAEVTVERAGIVKTLSNLAMNNGALYGALSILISLGAGFGVGLVFKKSGGGH